MARRDQELLDHRRSQGALPGVEPRDEESTGAGHSSDRPHGRNFFRSSNSAREKEAYRD